MTIRSPKNAVDFGGARRCRDTSVLNGFECALNMPSTGSHALLRTTAGTDPRRLFRSNCHAAGQIRRFHTDPRPPEMTQIP